MKVLILNGSPRAKGQHPRDDRLLHRRSSGEGPRGGDGGLPAQLKGVMDCIFSLVVGGKDVAGKKCALITCCEEHDATVMDGVRQPVERSAALLKWEMVGTVEIPGVFVEGDIHKTDGCKQAAELAERF